MEPGLRGTEAAMESGLGYLTGPGFAAGGITGIGSLKVSSLSFKGSITLPIPGRGDFGEPLSRLLASELLNFALRAFTSTVSP